MRRPLHILLLLLTTCVEPYPLPERTANSQILIVDSFLDATNNVVKAKLTRSVNLTDAANSQPEESAIVQLEQENGSIIPLVQTAPGEFTASVTTNLDSRYRINIQTAEDSFFSSFERINRTPEIDSLTWTTAEDGIDININAHDPSGKSRYYYWSYVETWEYRAAFQSSFKFENGRYEYRLPEEDIYKCWSTKPSTNITIGTTNRLAEDILSQYAIFTIPLRSERLNYNYSVLVNQITISQGAYDFWQQLKRNTESLGTLFDPQPSQITGNFSSKNQGEIIGYFFAGTVAQQRLTITLEDLPDPYQFIQDIGLCEEDTVLINELPQFQPKTYNLIVGVYNTFGSLIGFRYSTHFCTDCVLQGGTREKPSFFP